jgi:hypothetical protein
MPPTDARAPDVSAATPAPAVDLMGDAVHHRLLRSTGRSSVRRWTLWASFALAVIVASAGAVLLASTDHGSDAAAPGGSSVSPSGNHSAAHSGSAHRHTPIRRISPHA